MSSGDHGLQKMRANLTKFIIKKRENLARLANIPAGPGTTQRQRMRRKNLQEQIDNLNGTIATLGQQYKTSKMYQKILDKQEAGGGAAPAAAISANGGRKDMKSSSVALTDKALLGIFSAEGGVARTARKAITGHHHGHIGKYRKSKLGFGGGTRRRTKRSSRGRLIFEAALLAAAVGAAGAIVKSRRKRRRPKRRTRRRKRRNTRRRKRRNTRRQRRRRR